MRSIDFDIPILYGGAKKPINLQNEEELGEANERALQRAKEKAFSIGQPIILGLKGKIVAEYADGSRFLIIGDEISDIPYEG